MVLAPYFLATKLEAFDGRGKGDYLSSHDIEDIVAVLDGRPEILDELLKASKSYRPIWLTDLHPCWKLESLLRLSLDTCQAMPQVKGECR